MRKGRSSRRGRNSRPLVGVKSPASTGDVLSSEVGPTAPPQIIVGIPPSDRPPAEARTRVSDAPAPVESSDGSLDASVRTKGVEALDLRSPKLPIDPLEALEALDQPKTPSTAIGDPEPEQAAEHPGAKTEAKSEPAPEELEDDPRTKPSAASSSEEDLKKSAGRGRASSDPDYVSVPPMGDLATVDEKFFSDGEDAHRLVADGLDAHDALTTADTAARKADPVVVQRRERFARYVKWAVAGAAVVCLAAVGRTTMTSSTPATAAPLRMAATVVVAPETAAAATKAAEPAAAPVNPEPTPAPSAADRGAPATATSTTDSASAEANPHEVSGDPKEEKAKAQSLLERRKINEAIEAGERSVALDPTDGEAWLILGAAYQEKGNMVDARRAYASCLKEGKTGPRQECSKMLR